MKLEAKHVHLLPTQFRPDWQEESLVVTSMVTYAVPKESLAVIDFLRQAIECPQGKTVPEGRVHEFERCRYLLEHQREPDQLVTVSFAASQPLPASAQASLARDYAGVAQLIEPTSAYQLSLQARMRLTKCTLAESTFQNLRHKSGGSALTGTARTSTADEQG